MDGNLLRIHNVSKNFAGVSALQDIDLSVRAGTVHIIAGENGAGKSTLIKIISGIHTPDAGEVYLDDSRVERFTPTDALRRGVATIFQESAIYQNLSVLENVFLRNKMKRGGINLLDWKAMSRRAEALFAELGENINTRRIMSGMSAGVCKIVEIARALMQNSRLIIMDEPTSSLSEKEVRSLFRQIGILKSKGMTILYITHKLEEIFEIGDNVTVLRDGRVVGTRAVKEIDKGQLIEMMIGRKLEVFFPHIEVRQGRPVLELEDCTSSRGRFRHVSFALHDGEILGLYGLVGAGRTELAQAIFGVDRAYQGTIKLNGKKVSPDSPQGSMNLGVAYLPENRQLEGLVLKMDISNNITLAVLKEITRRGFVRKNLELRRAASSIESMRIVCTGPDQTVENLSGGNQQKVLVGKWLNLRPKVLILDEPTHGIDVATKAEVYHLMKILVEQGTPILLISSELPEIIGMSSRILVMGGGVIRGEFKRDEWTREKIIEAAIAG